MSPDGSSKPDWLNKTNTIISIIVGLIAILTFFGIRWGQSSGGNGSLPPSSPPTTRPATSQPEPPTNPTFPSVPVGGRFSGSWSGTTDQGKSISFQVSSDSVGEAVHNLAVSFQFDAPCPIGEVTFSSTGDAHIFDGASSSFRVLNMQESAATASLEGAFTSDTAASGTLRITDTRDNSERLDRPCPFTTTIKWKATKQ